MGPTGIDRYWKGLSATRFEQDLLKKVHYCLIGTEFNYAYA